MEFYNICFFVCTLLLSLSKMCLRLIHVRVHQSFIPSCCQIRSHCTDVPHFVYHHVLFMNPPAVSLSAIMNNDAMNIIAQIFVWTYVLFYLDRKVGVESLGHYRNLFLTD